MTDIYNNNTYIANNPTIHSEDSEFKFKNIEPLLNNINIEKNQIKILDVGGGAGIIGKYVLDFFENKNIMVLFDSLDLSTEMLKVQKKNNPAIKKIINCTIEECKENNYDLILMIDVIEHIERKNDTAKILNKISKYIIYNIPIEKNLFDFIKNLTLLFRYYRNQRKTLGHVHFFSVKTANDFLKKHHEIIDSFFQPYCFYFRDSLNENYLKLRKNVFRNFEIKLSCWIHNNASNLSKYIIQGSNYALVKSK